MPDVQPSTLAIRLTAASEDSQIAVTLLVDGVDVLAEAKPGYMGYPPQDMLFAPSPLLPGTQPQRRGLYICGCGWPEDGSITAEIGVDLEQGLILWRTFIQYDGAFSEPIDPEYFEGTAVRYLDLPQFTFDAAKYEAEVRRASKYYLHEPEAAQYLGWPQNAAQHLANVQRLRPVFDGLDHRYWGEEPPQGVVRLTLGHDGTVTSATFGRGE